MGNGTGMEFADLQLWHQIRDLTITAALGTTILLVFLFFGKLWERRFGRSTVFSFDKLRRFILGGAVLTAVLLIISVLVAS